MATAKVFISYSPKDETEKDELVSHLSVLQHIGLIELWGNNQIGAGEDWSKEIDRAIEQTHVAILLISNNFLGAKFLLRSEVARLLERHRKKEITIFPIIAKRCAWRNVKWLARMRVRPKNEEAVWREGGRYVDEELAAIVEEIAETLEPTIFSDFEGVATHQYLSMVHGDGRGSHPHHETLAPNRRGTMNYEHALDSLKAQMEQTNRYIEFTTLEARLRENLQDERLFGTNEANRSDRARVVNSFNRLSLELLKVSFNDLALGCVSEIGQTSVRDLALVHQLNPTLQPDKIKPPVQSRLQDLPFNELSWEQFEALCAALIEAQPITISSNLYGVQGDDQQGIDIVTSQTGAERIETWAYQCKRYKEYTAGKLNNAIAVMTYPADYYVIMLSIPATAAVRKVGDEQSNVFLWDAKDIARKLKNYPVIVEDFFGTAWRKAFCMET